MCKGDKDDNCRSCRTKICQLDTVIERHKYYIRAEEKLISRAL